MRTYASPRPGHCASCEGAITGRPVYRMEQAYCCLGCARGEPCICSYEADMADDGVNGLGLLFSTPQGAAPETVREAEAAREVTASGRDERVAAAELAEAGVR